MKYIYFLCMWFALNSQFQIVHAADTIFTKHIIKPPQTEPTINTVPNMVYLHDVDDDGNIDIIASHVSWEKKYIHPYVAWYKGPDFKEEIHQETRVRIKLLGKLNGIQGIIEKAGAVSVACNGRSCIFKAAPDRRLSVIRAIESAGGVVNEFHTEPPDWESLLHRHFNNYGGSDSN